MNPASRDLLDRVRARLASGDGDLSPERVAAALRLEGGVVGDRTVLDLVEALRRETVGLGPLEQLATLPGVTDILVNGPREVHVDTGGGLRLTEVAFADDAAVRRLAQRLAAAGGRRLDDSAPFVDVRLPDGIRFHAVLAPVARPGTLLSLRVPAGRAYSLDDLRQRGTVTDLGRDLLGALVRSRTSFVVSGGTGSGKTTVLNALLGLVDPVERIVLVEDASELRPDHPHVVALEGRPPNVEGAGGIELTALVRQALRMRPDRLVVGEVRGAEVTDLLAALNTGHDGGCATIHANSAADVPARFEALALTAGLSRAAVHSQLASGLRAAVHLRRDRSGTRRLQQISVLEPDHAGRVVSVPAVRFGADGSPSTGAAANRLDGLLDGA